MKHLLISVIAATIIIPALAARSPSAAGGARRMIFWLLVFNVLYVAFVAFVFAPYGMPERPR